MFFNQNFDNNKRDGIFLIKLVKTIIHLRCTNYKTLNVQISITKCFGIQTVLDEQSNK